jgi:low temperature requirement protein LtrA
VAATWTYQALPIVAVIGFVAAGAVLSWRRPVAAARLVWMAPATLSCLLFLWSAYAVLSEGPLGFWSHHTQGAWANQIWFDLLLSLGVGFALLAPGARALGMRVAPWFVLILCTGSIGLLAMLARYLFLREQASTPVRASS